MEEVGQRPRILYRRFRKEINKIPSEYNVLGYKVYVLKTDINDFLLNYDYQHNYDPKHQLKFFGYPISFQFEKNNLFLNMKITDMDEYPFKPPKIILKDKNLLRHYYSNLFIKYKKYLEAPKNCCLVCSSVLSGSNWTCVTSFSQVFYEMVFNFINIKRAIEMLHMEKIVFRHTSGDEYLMDYMVGFL
jgi:ubiquitin-protein ligase